MREVLHWVLCCIHRRSSFVICYDHASHRRLWFQPIIGMSPSYSSSENTAPGAWLHWGCSICDWDLRLPEKTWNCQSPRHLDWSLVPIWWCYYAISGHTFRNSVRALSEYGSLWSYHVFLQHEAWPEYTCMTSFDVSETLPLFVWWWLSGRCSALQYFELLLLVYKASTWSWFQNSGLLGLVLCFRNIDVLSLSKPTSPWTDSRTWSLCFQAAVRQSFWFVDVECRTVLPFTLLLMLLNPLCCQLSCWSSSFAAFFGLEGPAHHFAHLWILAILVIELQYHPNWIRGNAWICHNPYSPSSTELWIEVPPRHQTSSSWVTFWHIRGLAVDWCSYMVLHSKNIQRSWHLLPWRYTGSSISGSKCMLQFLCCSSRLIDVIWRSQSSRT